MSPRQNNSQGWCTECGLLSVFDSANPRVHCMAVTFLFHILTSARGLHILAYWVYLTESVGEYIIRRLLKDTHVYPFTQKVTQWRIRKKICEKRYAKNCFANLRKTRNSSMLNQITNHASKARADWLKNFYSPWESRGYKIESQNGQLRLTWNLSSPSLGGVIITEQETITIHGTRASEEIIKWNLEEFTRE